MNDNFNPYAPQEPQYQPQQPVQQGYPQENTFQPQPAAQDYQPQNPYQPQPAAQDYQPQNPYQPQPMAQDFQQQNPFQPQPMAQEYQQQSPYQPQPYQQPYSYPPQYQQNYYPYRQPAPRDRQAGMAKAFAIVSFIAGCVSLLTVITVLFGTLLTLGVNDSYYYGSVTQDLRSMPFVYVFLCGIPGTIFGILALVKKTRLVPMAVLGVVFNGMLLLTAAFSFLFYL